jgi:hypothetical protein
VGGASKSRRGWVEVAEVWWECECECVELLVRWCALEPDWVLVEGRERLLALLLLLLLALLALLALLGLEVLPVRFEVWEGPSRDGTALLWVGGTGMCEVTDKRDSVGDTPRSGLGYMSELFVSEQKIERTVSGVCHSEAAER